MILSYHVFSLKQQGFFRSSRIMMIAMSKTASKSTEPVNERVARMRREFGYTQAELAEQLGVLQSVVSAYESGGRRFHTEMIIKFAELFGVSADELLGIEKPSTNGQKVSVHLAKRMQKIQELPKAKQKALLQTIDLFLKGAEM